MKFHKFISTILHPIVLPTLGVFLYFVFVSQSFEKRLQLIVLGLVFALTYVVPVLLLLFLRNFGFIKDFQVSTIKERRFPVIFMIFLLYFLGNTIIQIPTIRNLGILFYGTSLSLTCIYVLFSVKLKSSLHLVSMGNMIGFFLIMTNINSLSMLPIIILLILLSGILASSRLYLKAHTPVELLIGFSLGIVCQFILFISLQ
jgi:membrane-associated phospholipid phosphatase|tara:strand:+ start:4866 stop:5468 length:603 start_codon:yes stop_codon:yes gene_type:complete